MCTKALKLLTGNCEVENVEGAVIYLKIIDAAVHGFATVEILVREDRSAELAGKISSLAAAAYNVTR